MKMKKSNKGKAFKIIILSVGFGLLLLSIAIYFIIHSYINKINIVKTDETAPSTIAIDEDEEQLEVPDIEEVEEEPSDIPDSPEEDIIAMEETIRKNMEENSTTIPYDKDVFHILLIGSDTRDSGDRGRSDSMIIISINKKTKKIVATSILRDIYLQIPGRKNNRINTAYAYGGADLLLETIKQNFKIDISRYVSINFNSFIDVVDSIGGVTLEVTEEEIPVINRYVRELNELNGLPIEKDVLSEPGTYVLNGVQTLGFARNRYVGYGDFERTARQREVLEQIFNKVKELNLIEINRLMNKVLPQVTTNLTEGELFSMILSLPSYATYSIEEWSIPMKGSYRFERIRGMSVIGIDFDENIAEFRNKIYEN